MKQMLRNAKTVSLEVMAQPNLQAMVKGGVIVNKFLWRFYMKKSAFFLAITVLMTLFVTCSTDENKDTNKLHRPDSKKIMLTQPLNLEVTTNKLTYNLGDYIFVTYDLCNTSPDDIIILTHWYDLYPEISLTLIGPDNNPVQRLFQWEVSYPVLNSFSTLPAGMCKSEEFALNWSSYTLFNIMLPGQYSMIGRYSNEFTTYRSEQDLQEIEGSVNAWVGTIESATVTFTINP
jgi:hypothetical protein